MSACASSSDPAPPLLFPYAGSTRCGIRSDEWFVADARTVAYSRTSTGQHLRVSLGRAPPPASSFVYYDFPDTSPGVEDGDDTGADECEEEDDDECEEDHGHDVDGWRITNGPTRPIFSAIAPVLPFFHGSSSSRRQIRRRRPNPIPPPLYLLFSPPCRPPPLSPAAPAAGFAATGHHSPNPALPSPLS
ncbi:hypothetical protein C2845_PM18G01910 [Panicum miliaceum]|uniref:Uncharacterized protein n=1 Tax=Panicum miliaceum TaxID=4540 RepID=A0A3L6PKI4_PANMI|nr:hypothetical protein C2845_PM18G01910 [Panicum miliaceum]